MRRLTLAVLALAALAALPIATGSAKPPGGNHSLSLHATPNPVVFFRTVALSGKFTGNNHANKTVTLQKDRFPYGAFVNAGNTTTNSAGNYAITAHPPVNTRYRTKVGNTTSPIVTEKVRIRTRLRLSDSTPAAGHRVRFFGRACPQHDGATVRIQRFNHKLNKWTTKRSTVLRNIPGSSCSKYSRRFRVFHDGTYRTVVVSPHGDHANGVSRRRHINAH
ncbi:MAG: hypothetical protein ABR581_01270 [Thermoleophilaceae bacterium]